MCIYIKSITWCSSIGCIGISLLLIIFELWWYFHSICANYFGLKERIQFEIWKMVSYLFVISFTLTDLSSTIVFVFIIVRFKWDFKCFTGCVPPQWAEASIFTCHTRATILMKKKRTKSVINWKFISHCVITLCRSFVTA